MIGYRHDRIGTRTMLQLTLDTGLLRATCSLLRMTVSSEQHIWQRHQHLLGIYTLSVGHVCRNFNT